MRTVTLVGALILGGMIVLYTSTGWPSMLAIKIGLLFELILYFIHLLCKRRG
ncbi:hypothetical protein [Sporolactobacillus spathodeae]|uniref:Signal transduction protein with EAL and GGDEF domain n=1 Tax=Sporolactobacillus spathodeae TaxID=1465502 RepID=A0ABS2Q4H9_9BACL|nr:hypothetical protein [Sporolactobacillus spathodeae]MBM7656688.1 putative signal transduction protein with EAL and GGDEF domain [Sporolactobacillus spathodeae]